MKFTLVAALTLVAFAAESQAAWCCCRGADAGSQNCCTKVKNGGTFYSPKCGLMNGQTCDLGPNLGDQEAYKDCCRYEDGDRGFCF